MKKRWVVFLLLSSVLVLTLFPAAQPAVAQNEDDYHYFPETGHYVQGAFWAYYQGVPDAELVLGYPITEQLARGDKLVQYFEHMRLEFENGQVHPTPVGRALYEEAPGLHVDNPAACRTFSTGFSVCYAFLYFFDEHGGQRVFGAPISDFIFANGRIVQYFENARLEWRPWLPVGQKVGVADLGLAYFDYMKEDPSLRRAVAPEALIRPLALNVRVFVWRTVTRPSDTQIVYVVVRDQASQPLAGVQGVLEVTWPDGQVESRVFQTNEQGFTQQTLTFHDLPPGELVQVQVRVNSGGVEGQATTSFRIWH